MNAGSRRVKPHVGQIHARNAIVAERIGVINIGGVQSVRFPGWTRISFEDQEGIESALEGQALGPRHVLACPAVPSVDEVVTRLLSTRTALILGESGSGKSMIAWHAAYRLSQLGWDIYLLINPMAANADVPASRAGALLVVENAQLFEYPPVNTALAGPERAVLVVSTAPIAGFRSIIRVVPKQSVESIAAALQERRDELGPILKNLDPRIGEGPFEIPVELQIDSAKRSSTLPWQFMFNLGSGHHRLKNALDGLNHSPALSRLLFIVASYQLASMDSPCPVGWLEKFARQNSREDVEDINRLLDECELHFPLVRTEKYVATPHARVAAWIVNTMFDGRGDLVAQRRKILWALLQDSTLPVGGIAWVLIELASYVVRSRTIPEEVTVALAERCFSAEHHGQAGNALARLLLCETFDKRIVDDHQGLIAGWSQAHS